MIPYARQDIRQEDIDAVVAALRSDWLTQGPAVPAFERALAAYCGTRHGVAVNSATSAFILRALRLAWGPAIGSGPVPTPSWHRPTAGSTAAQAWISSTSTPVLTI